MNNIEHVGKKYSFVLVAMIALCTVAACLNAMMLQTSVRQVTADLGSDNYEWISSIFILCECIAMPIAGRLSDIYGRRTVFTMGVALFLFGSLFCTVAPNMGMFLILRGIQGAGCGITVMTSVAIVGDLYNKEERIRMHCVMAAAFGFGFMYGVFFGDFLTIELGWRYGFYISAAVFAICAFITMHLMGPSEKTERNIDIAGLTLLSLLITDIVVYAQCINDKFSWNDPVSLTMIVIGLLLLFAFIYAERRSDDPYVPRYVRNRNMLLVSLICVGALGFFIMGSISYVIRMAVVTFHMDMGETAIVFIWIMVGVLVTSFICRFTVQRTGSKVWIIAGAVLSAVSICSMSMMDPGDSDVVFAFHIFILGLGMGCLMALLNRNIQNRADDSDNGSMTSFGLMIRTVGTFAGSAFYLSLINENMRTHLEGILPSAVPSDMDILIALQDPSYGQMLYGYLDDIVFAFTDGIGQSLIIGGGLVLILLVAVFTCFLYRTRSA